MFLTVNARGQHVLSLQTKLKELGFYESKVDGNFGANTMQAVIDFQKSKGLNADGVVGPKTWAALEMEKPEHPPIISVPQSRDEVEAMFGDPLQSGWAEEYLAFCETPPELNHCFTYKNKQGKHGFYCNKLLIPMFQKVYKGIVDAKLEKELKTFDGCWNVRKIRGGNNLSTHSWAISVDHNAAENALGANPKMDDRIVAIFENVGFYWGGHFRRKDGMHFQWARNV